MKIIAKNKKAFFDYFVVETLEAGIALMGSEVKSLVEGHIVLKDSYVSFSKGEAFLQKAHISEYKQSSHNNHEPERLRKLLLHRKEIEKLQHMIQAKGYSCIPLKVYFKNGKIKLEIGIVRGKKQYDKRQSLKEKATQREMDKSLKRPR